MHLGIADAIDRGLSPNILKSRKGSFQLNAIYTMKLFSRGIQKAAKLLRSMMTKRIVSFLLTLAVILTFACTVWIFHTPLKENSAHNDIVMDILGQSRLMTAHEGNPHHNLSSNVSVGGTNQEIKHFPSDKKGPAPFRSNRVVIQPDISEIGPSFTYPTPINHAPPKMLRYFKWHQVQMECIRNAACYRSKRSTFRIMLWRCPMQRTSQCSGVGDRFRGIISSLVIAMLTNHVFLLQWPDHPYPFLTAVWPAAIDWRVPNHVARHTGNWPILIDSHYPSVRLFRRSFGELNKNNTPRAGQSSGMSGTHFSGNVELKMRMDDSRTYKMIKNVKRLIIFSRGTYSIRLIKRPEWSYGFYDNARHSKNQNLPIHRFLLRALFKPSRATEGLIRSTISENASQHGYVSLHARTGKDVRETFFSRFRRLNRLSATQLAQRFMYCLGQAGVERKYVFVASDSNQFKKAFGFLSQYQNMTVMYTNMPAVHIGKRWVDNKRDAQKNNISFQGFMNIFVDFFALSNGTSIISNRSEFSRLANIVSNAVIFRTFDAARDTNIMPCKWDVNYIPSLRGSRRRRQRNLTVHW